MADYLLYWKTFWDKVINLEDVSHDWHTKNVRFYRQVQKGDNFWVVISGGRDYYNEWRLLSRSCVARPNPRRVNTQHGQYHIISDEQRSELFDPYIQDDFAPILKQLDFASGKKIKKSGREIGQTLEVARRLTDTDVEILKRSAQKLVSVPTTESLTVSRQSPAALAEDGYFRESSQNLYFILQRHNILSNDFAAWLKKSGYSNIIQEQNYVDIVFERDGRSYRAELKICYGIGSTKAIREALGQLLEYNYYPSRVQANYWVIVLDEKPKTSDIKYLRTLKNSLNLPLSLSWRERKGFASPDDLEIS